MTIIEFPTTVADLTALDYVTQKHVCDEDGFDPVECVPCGGCNHAECRHRMDDLPGPVAKIGLSPVQLLEVLRVEAIALQAAMTATPCEVDGCDCTRMKCGDECERCGGEGTVDDDRTGRTYECNGCAGHGVVA